MTVSVLSVQISTVNVIVSYSDMVCEVKSFPDNELGNKAAKKWFEVRALEFGFDKEDVEEGLEERVLSNPDGHTLWLIHSN